MRTGTAASATAASRAAPRRPAARPHGADRSRRRRPRRPAGSHRRRGARRAPGRRARPRSTGRPGDDLAAVPADDGGQPVDEARPAAVQVEHAVRGRPQLARRRAGVEQRRSRRRRWPCAGPRRAWPGRPRRPSRGRSRPGPGCPAHERSVGGAEPAPSPVRRAAGRRRCGGGGASPGSARRRRGRRPARASAAARGPAHRAPSGRRGRRRRLVQRVGPEVEVVADAAAGAGPAAEVLGALDRR